MRNLLPKDAWALLQQHPDSLFVDVRMEIESLYVGRPPGVHLIAWYEYPDLTPDAPGFVRQIEREADGKKTRPVVLICRSGKRSVDAALALEAAGFTDGYRGLVSTGLAVLAYRKVNDMDRKEKATGSIFKKLARGKGGFKLANQRLPLQARAGH